MLNIAIWKRTEKDISPDNLKSSVDHIHTVAIYLWFYALVLECQMSCCCVSGCKSLKCRKSDKLLSFLFQNSCLVNQVYRRSHHGYNQWAAALVVYIKRCDLHIQLLCRENTKYESWVDSPYLPSHILIVTIAWLWCAWAHCNVDAEVMFCAVLAHMESIGIQFAGLKTIENWI